MPNRKSLHRFENDAENMMEDISETGSDIAGRVSEAAHNAGEAVRDMAGRASHAVGEGYNQASEKAKEVYEQGREMAEKVGENVRSSVQNQPLTSILIAAGIGVVIGFLMSGHRDD
jgi:ElaB/YqjD/DUF883 family membrane-anchored ribosome-binding protein